MSPPRRTSRPARSAAARSAGVDRRQQLGRAPARTGASSSQRERGQRVPWLRCPTRAPAPTGRSGRRGARRAGGGEDRGPAGASPRRVNGGGSGVERRSRRPAPRGPRGRAARPGRPRRAAGPARPQGEPGVVGAERPHPHRRRGGADVQGDVGGIRSTSRCRRDVDAPSVSATHRGRAGRCRGGRRGRHAAQVHRQPGRPADRRRPARRAPAGRAPAPRSPSSSQVVAARDRARRQRPGDHGARAPVTVNERSTQSRTGPSGSPARRGAATRRPGARAASSSPAPVRADVDATATGTMPCPASRAERVAGRRGAGPRGRLA